MPTMGAFHCLGLAPPDPTDQCKKKALFLHPPRMETQCFTEAGASWFFCLVFITQSLEMLDMEGGSCMLCIN